jgi:hypothetical protein
VPPISAARPVFNKLTLRLEDRSIAASANTSVLSKAGKPYALRFHRSSSSTAACSMRRSAVHRSARHCRAYAQRPRPDSWPAYYTFCRHVPVSPSHHPRIASSTYDAGRAALTRVSAAIVALQLGPPHARQTDLHGHVGAVGGRPGIASHAKLCAGGPDTWRRK